MPQGHVSDDGHEEAATVLAEEQISAAAWMATVTHDCGPSLR
ncbi:hypothetical protein ACGFY3_06585 [Streptomyces mirabilis]